MVAFYSHTTWAQLKTALSLRLSDPNKIYWVDGELGLYLVEALRTWGVMTSYWRDTGVLTTTSGVAFYNLTSLNNASGEALLSNTTTDQDIVRRIQYHLLEPSTGSTWTGSEQFTLADLTNSIQKRRDQLLADTGCVVTRTTGIAVPPSASRIFLSDSVIAIRRLAFVGSDGVITPLFPSDVFAQRNYSSSELYTPNPPYSYSSASTRPTEILLVPPSNAPGTLDLLAINTGAALNPTAGVVLGIPDDYTWAVKWGAMADLLAKDGPARDQIRSAYCERRYKLAVELINLTSVMVNAEINGVPLDTDSIANTDAYSSSWQSATDTPYAVASTRTLVALAPCPDGVYSITFDVVCKAPIPAGILAQTTANDTDYVQIGREQLDPILDYAQHLAAFKMAGEELRATIKGAQNFFNAALAYNERLAGMNPNVLTLMAQAFQDIEDRQYRVTGGLGALQGQPVSGGSATLDKSGSGNPNNPDEGDMG